MKNILIILFVFVFGYVGISQPVVNRSGGVVTVQDSRWMGQYNLFVPRYQDTTTANISSNLGIDSCGAIIYTYDVGGLWVRRCDPVKHWEQVGSGTGGTNANVGSGYRWAIPNTNNIKTVFPSFGILIDSTTNTNSLTLQADTSQLSTLTALRDTANSLRTKFDSSYYDISLLPDSTGYIMYHFDGRQDTVKFNLSPVGINTGYGINGIGTALNPIILDTSVIKKFSTIYTDYDVNYFSSLHFNDTLYLVSTYGIKITTTDLDIGFPGVDFEIDTSQVILNQYSHAQTGNIWINGNVKAQGILTIGPDYTNGTYNSTGYNAIINGLNGKQPLLLLDTISNRYYGYIDGSAAPGGTMLSLVNASAARDSAIYTGIGFYESGSSGYNRTASFGYVSQAYPNTTKSFNYPGFFVWGFRGGTTTANRNYREGMRFVGRETADSSQRNHLYINDTTYHGDYNLNMIGGRYQDVTGKTNKTIGLATTSDTTNYKPYVRNSSTGEERQFTYWPVGSGGGSSQSYAEIIQVPDYTLTNTTSSQQLFNVDGASNGAFNVTSGHTYEFELQFTISGLSGSNHYTDFGFGGTATIDSIWYASFGNTASAYPSVSGSIYALVTSPTVQHITGASTTTQFLCRIKGQIKITGSGTLQPLIAMNSNAAAAVVGWGSYMKITDLGSSPVKVISNGITTN